MQGIKNTQWKVWASSLWSRNISYGRAPTVSIFLMTAFRWKYRVDLNVAPPTPTPRWDPGSATFPSCVCAHVDVQFKYSNHTAWEVKTFELPDKHLSYMEEILCFSSSTASHIRGSGPLFTTLPVCTWNSLSVRRVSSWFVGWAAGCLLDLITNSAWNEIIQLILNLKHVIQ